MIRFASLLWLALVVVSGLAVRGWLRASRVRDAGAGRFLMTMPPGVALDNVYLPITMTRDGKYVVFAQIKDGGSTTPRSGIWVARSADGGQTFTQTEVAAIDEIPSPLYPGGFRTPLPAPAIAADANGLYAVWAEELNGRAAIAFSRSVIPGRRAPATISLRVR